MKKQFTHRNIGKTVALQFNALPVIKEETLSDLLDSSSTTTDIQQHIQPYTPHGYYTTYYSLLRTVATHYTNEIHKHLSTRYSPHWKYIEYKIHFVPTPTSHLLVYPVNFPPHFDAISKTQTLYIQTPISATNTLAVQISTVKHRPSHLIKSSSSYPDLYDLSFTTNFTHTLATIPITLYSSHISCSAFMKTLYEHDYLLDIFSVCAISFVLHNKQ
jgi:hypothetical protein